MLGDHSRLLGFAMHEPDGTGNLVWIDLEMTGLDADTDVILEIATLVTDGRIARCGRRSRTRHSSRCGDARPDG